MVGDSPTMDEQNHIGRGLAFVRTGDPRLSLEHPPLVNSLSALPLLLLPDVTLPLDDPSWQRRPPVGYWYIFSDLLLWHMGHNVTQMIFLARLPTVFLTLALALVGFHFARLLWGRETAVFAALLLLFDPNIMAHGRYTTTDLGGSLFILLATLLLWRLWQRPFWAWTSWAWAALGMALAFGSKLSALTFVPIWGLLALLPLWHERPFQWQDSARRLAQLISAGLLSVVLLWAIFAFEWGPFRFAGELLQSLNGRVGPMPTFWAGIEQILFLSGGGRPSFLLGSWSNQGFWHYFPLAFLWKTPLLVQWLLLLAVPLLLWRRQTRRRALILLLPVVIYFGLSTQSALNIGYRHLLPIFPFIYLLLAGLLPALSHLPKLPDWANGRLLLRVSLLLLLLNLLWIHPHYLSYFNRIGGGPETGWQRLIDSNIDWGQDLLRLQAWLTANEIEHVRLGYFGTADPAYYGLDFEALPGFPRPEFLAAWTQPSFNTAAPEPGVYAISVHNLAGQPGMGQNPYTWFVQQVPTAQVGYSILIYEVQP